MDFLRGGSLCLAMLRPPPVSIPSDMARSSRMRTPSPYITFDERHEDDDDEDDDQADDENKDEPSGLLSPRDIAHLIAQMHHELAPRHQLAPDVVSDTSGHLHETERVPLQPCSAWDNMIHGATN